MTSWNIMVQSDLMKVFLQNDHATNFVKKWKNRFGMQGGDSIYNEFNQFKITYCRMQSASKRLKMMLQEHYRHIHAES